MLTRPQGRLLAPAWVVPSLCTLQHTSVVPYTPAVTAPPHTPAVWPHGVALVSVSTALVMDGVLPVAALARHLLKLWRACMQQPVCECNPLLCFDKHASPEVLMR